jgi:hypothetical protein
VPSAVVVSGRGTPRASHTVVAACRIPLSTSDFGVCGSAASAGGGFALAENFYALAEDFSSLAENLYA